MHHRGTGIVAIATSVLLLGLVIVPVRAPADEPGPGAPVADALRAGDFVAAEARATDILRTETLSLDDRAHLLLNRALAREQLGKRQAALGDFNIALAMDALTGRDLARALFDRGVTRDELGQTEQAIADYTAAIKAEPKFAAALNNRANAYRRLGRLSEARAGYLASLDAGNPQSQFPYYGLGQIAEAQGQPEKAMAYYRKAVAADPGYGLAAQRLASLGGQAPAKMAEAAFVLHPPVAAKPAAPMVMDDPPPPLPRIRPDPPRSGVRPAMARAASYHPQADVPQLRPAILGPVASAPVRVAQKTPRKIPSPGAMVQLGAWRDEGDAADGWNRVAGAAGDLLGGRTPQIISADVPGKGHYYRLRVGGMDWHQAADLCSQLKARDLACLPVRG